MSAPKYVWKLIAESGLSPELKPVAIMMALHGDWKSGASTFPSIGLIAWELGISSRTVDRRIRALREMGVLLPVNPGGGRLPGGKPRSVEYIVDSLALPERAPYLPRHQGGAVSRSELRHMRGAVGEFSTATAEAGTTPDGTLTTPKEPVNHATKVAHDLPSSDLPFRSPMYLHAAQKPRGADRFHSPERNANKKNPARLQGEFHCTICDWTGNLRDARAHGVEMKHSTKQGKRERTADMEHIGSVLSGRFPLSR